MQPDIDFVRIGQRIKIARQEKVSIPPEIAHLDR